MIFETLSSNASSPAGKQRHCLDRVQMKVLVCVWGLSGGGAERVTVTLSGALRTLGCEVVLSVSDPNGPFLQFVENGVVLEAADSRSHLTAFIHLKNLIKRFKPDIIVSHQTPRNVLSILAHLSTPDRAKRKIVVVEHGEMDYNSKQKGLGRRFYYFLARHIYRFSDSIVACSDNIAQAASEYILPAGTSVLSLPNPVLNRQMKALAREAVQHPWVLDSEAVPLLLGVGRLVDQKNFDLLIDAFALVASKRRVRMMILGEGPFRERLEEKIRTRGLQEIVALPGQVDNPFGYMAAARTLVLSSKWEGLPTVAIEALYCGAQVVSTPNSSGIVEILDGGQSGWIVEDFDPHKLAEAILESLEVPFAKSRLSQQAERYDELTSAAQYLEHFRHLVARDMLIDGVKVA